jgi:hypothetical protein
LEEQRGKQIKLFTARRFLHVNNRHVNNARCGHSRVKGRKNYTTQRLHHDFILRLSTSLRLGTQRPALPTYPRFRNLIFLPRLSRQRDCPFRFPPPLSPPSPPFPLPFHFIKSSTRCSAFQKRIRQRRERLARRLRDIRGDFWATVYLYDLPGPDLVVIPDSKRTHARARPIADDDVPRRRFISPWKLLTKLHSSNTVSRNPVESPSQMRGTSGRAPYIRIAVKIYSRGSEQRDAMIASLLGLIVLPYRMLSLITR